MDRADKLCPQGRVHRAMPGDTRLPLKGGTAQADTKMALATLLVTGVPTMRLAFVFNTQFDRRKDRIKALADFF